MITKYRLKTQQGQFDVPMGSFFGTEPCDSVWVFGNLRCLYKAQEIGLYLDEGLTIIYYFSGKAIKN